MTEEELETNRATWVSVSRMIRHAVDVFAVCLGVAILAGGTTRMGRPGYGPLLDLAPPWVWGAALLGAGVLAAARTPWVSAVGYTAIAVWCFTFATGFILVLIGSESGATTAPVVYLTMAWVAATLAWMRWECHRGTRAAA